MEIKNLYDRDDYDRRAYDAVDDPNAAHVKVCPHLVDEICQCEPPQQCAYGYGEIACHVLEDGLLA